MAFAVTPGVPDPARVWCVGPQRVQEDLTSALKYLLGVPHGGRGSGSPEKSPPVKQMFLTHHTGTGQIEGLNVADL